MKNTLAIGVLLVLIGVAMLAWPVISYTDRDTVVDVGPLEVTTEDTEHVRLPPVLGGIAVAAGIAIIVLGGKRRTV